MSPEATQAFVFVIGLFLSAFFSGAEAALISIPAKRVKQLIEDHKHPRILSFLSRHPSELLTTILIGNNFVNIFVASYATMIAQNYFDSDAVSYSVGITTLLVLIFGEIIPKTIMRNYAEHLIVPIVFTLRIIYFLMYPAVKIFMIIIKSVLGDGASLQERMITKDDIEFMVGEAEKEKSMDSKQIDLLTSILEFPTIKVKDIMTPRTSVHAIQTDSKFEDIAEMVKDVQHSRYPVFSQDLDSVLGFIHVKDIIFASLKERTDFNITKYVYEHMKIQAVFDHMNRKKVHLALVKDENGLMVGIITLEDIMEEIFGEIHDEHDDEEGDVHQNGDADLQSGVVLAGSISLRDLDEKFDVHIPLNDNYSTLRGFLLEMLGNNFPKQGNILFWEGLSFELIKVVDEEIEEVRIESTDGEKYSTSKNNSNNKNIVIKKDLAIS